jgi:hypothetical protein
MRAGRPRRMRLKSKRGRQRTCKHYKRLQSATTDDDNITEFEPTHSLLLSSLKFWEVERDLIEERVAANGR